MSKSPDGSERASPASGEVSDERTLRAFTGTFELPNETISHKPCAAPNNCTDADYITITSSGAVPQAGARVSPDDASAPHRTARPPRLPKELAPRIPTAGAISQDPAEMPDSIAYDEARRRLLIGHGYVEGVPPQVWNYEVSGKHVLRQWFSYCKANRERPIIGDRRQPSKLGDIQSDHWLAEYTTELINVLNVLGRLVELEQAQAELLEQIAFNFIN